MFLLAREGMRSRGGKEAASFGGMTPTPAAQRWAPPTAEEAGAMAKCSAKNWSIWLLEGREDSSGYLVTEGMRQRDVTGGGGGREIIH
jgi:hypothetical protein